MILRVHLVPFLGAKRLDAIRSEDVQRLKRGLQTEAPKTVNNVLTVLSVTLRKAVEWGVIERMPCTIRLLPAPDRPFGSTTSTEFERLVTAAVAFDARAQLLVLLAEKRVFGRARWWRWSGRIWTW